MASSFVAETLSILEIKADNNYDVGFKIGSYFGHTCTNIETNTTGKMKMFYESKKGKTMFDDFLAKTTESYPNVIDELRGMADGSGQPFDQLFLNSIISEITLTSAMLNKSVPCDDEVAGCTDVLVNTDQCRLLAHNEDWTTDVSKNAFLVDVEIDRSTNKSNGRHEQYSINGVLRNRNERFCSFVFPGVLSGITFAMNKHFAFTINSLVPSNFNEGSIILFVLLRSLLGCETIEECVQVMEGKPFGCSYGININVASIQTKDMWSIEVYPDKRATIVHLLHLPQQITSNGCSQYVHTNHYKHIANVEEETGLEGSKARELVANAASVPTCVEDVCKILGDRSSNVQPIYRLPTVNRNVVTAASAVFDLNAKKLHIYLGNPSIAGNRKTTVPFID